MQREHAYRGAPINRILPRPPDNPHNALGAMCDLPKTLSCVLGRLVLASSVLLLSPGLVLDAAEDSGPVRIGVLAKRGPERCLEKWGPTAEYLTAEISGYSFLITPLGHNEVGPAVQCGEVEFVLTNPSSYVELERLYNVSRIVTLKNLHLGKAYTVYAAVIFRRSDSDDIRDLGDLKGRTFMAVDEQSFGRRVKWTRVPFEPIRLSAWRWKARSASTNSR